MKLADYKDLPHYFRKFCALAIELGDDISTVIQIQYFIQGLPYNIQDYCNTQSCKTLTEVFKKASELYRGPQNNEYDRNATYDGIGLGKNQSSSGRATNGSTMPMNQEDRRHQNGEILCYFCKYTGHTQRNCQYYLQAQQEAQKHEKIKQVSFKEDFQGAEPGTDETYGHDGHAVEGDDGAEGFFGNMYDN